MTPQELKAALDAFAHAVRAQTAISAFRSGAVPVFKHHNARPPRKCRRHEARKQTNYPLWLRKSFGYLARPHILHPEPDGA